jgi:hypothetical protein
MSPSRRNLLKLMAGGVVLASTGVGAFLSTREPSRALAPWAKAGAYDDPRLAILSTALLAPNPHNRQPWVLALEGEDSFALYAQADRKLPHTDPQDRQITIGLGCFLEVARMAAAQRQLALNVTSFPDGEPWPTLDDRPVARVRLVPDASGITTDPLFAHVTNRRSCKEPFDLSRPVEDDLLAALGKTATVDLSHSVSYGASGDTTHVAALRDLGWRAHEIEMQTPRTLRESVELMRFGKTQIEANPDGIDLGGPFLESLQVSGLMSRDDFYNPNSQSYVQGLEMYKAMFDNTPAFAWLSTSGNTRREQLDAGAAWIRLNLATTRSGLALHPVSQSLQEYPEMAPLLAEVHQTLPMLPTGHRVQMLGRVGYGPAIAPSPRWPLESRLRPA